MTRQDLIDMDLGDVIVFENPDYDDYIIGVSTDNRAIYSLEKMVEWYCDKENCSDDEALDFINYNTIKSLPYVEGSPIVMDDL